MPHGGRHYFWVDTNHALQVASGGKSETSLMTGISSTESRMGMTLIRLLLCWDLSHLLHDSGEGTQRPAIGIGIASQEAFAAGTLPEPEDDTEFPMGGWLFKCSFRTYGFAADAPAAYSRVIERDLRAKRKLNNGELFLTLTNVPDGGTAGTVTLIGITRALWLST